MTTTTPATVGPYSGLSFDDVMALARRTLAVTEASGATPEETAALRDLLYRGLAFHFMLEMDDNVAHPLFVALDGVAHEIADRNPPQPGDSGRLAEAAVCLAGRALAGAPDPRAVFRTILAGLNAAAGHEEDGTPLALVYTSSCGDKRPGWRTSGDVLDRLPCAQPCRHDGDHADSFGRCWPAEDSGTDA
ncbi:hypothetical protein RKE29_02190 [Streptomyces sp. B1866]|uniref:hypothetical protein n=1 Tax=Streptomyces sp. B1866 TaxID=3075431 RepID=UPI0028917214|nr:hypothetical protein [Streptomyces sp. B1866]MDT3395471.1 hypothetical protein [Streptomyces sp. B1866]